MCLFHVTDGAVEPFRPAVVLALFVSSYADLAHVLGRGQHPAGRDPVRVQAVRYYVYGILRHPGYREKFKDNPNRELPRIHGARLLAV